MKADGGLVGHESECWTSRLLLDGFLGSCGCDLEHLTEFVIEDRLNGRRRASAGEIWGRRSRPSSLVVDVPLRALVYRRQRASSIDAQMRSNPLSAEP